MMKTNIMPLETLTSEPLTVKSQYGVTLQDVARAMQLSESTVSLAISGKGRVAQKTRERVRQTAREMGFQPNPAGQQLAKRHRNANVALFTLYLDLGVDTQKLQLLQNLLSSQGFSTPIHVCWHPVYGEAVSQADLMRDLRLQRPRAIVCNDESLEPLAINELRRFMDEGGTVVCYDTQRDLNCDRVVFDREHNTYMAARHLLELGHRNIGFFLGVTGRSSPNARLNGLRRALAEYNAPFLSQWLDFPFKETYEQGGVHLAQYFLQQKERPTAMCIVNDRAAIGFMAHVQRNGLQVPRDVSVVSHDDLPVATLGTTVTLTSASHPVEEISQQVARMVTERLNGQYTGDARLIHVQGEFRVRESCAPLANS